MKRKIILRKKCYWKYYLFYDNKCAQPTLQWNLIDTTIPKLLNSALASTIILFLDLERRISIGKSPADELLDMWAQQNHTVTELFMLLYRMHQYTAMEVIRNLVDNKYHRLILKQNTNFKKNNSKVKHDQCEFIQINNILDAEVEAKSQELNQIKVENDSLFSVKIVNEYASTIPHVDYTELKQATDDWNNNNLLGKGGFGIVYKGSWKHTLVAIKKLVFQANISPEDNKIQLKQSLNELKFLNSCRHDNILPLYGYSINGMEPCLIYQLMLGGSLEQKLSLDKQQLPIWLERLNIARGIARGLQFLHTVRTAPLIHGDIKPANILLDLCNQPKIGDFGLAREGPNNLNSSMEVSKVYGTKPYLPFEFIGHRSLSTKVDTYSFGVVILELVTGLKAYDKFRKHKYLTKHIMFMCRENLNLEEFVDRRTSCDNFDLEICTNLIRIGCACIADSADKRPEMVNVLRHLENN